MRHRDVRLVLRNDLQNLIDDTPATIGISRLGPYFYTVMPGTVPLKSDKVLVQLQEPWQKADFFLRGFPRQTEPAYQAATIREIEARGGFKYEKSYNTPVGIFGYQFSLARFPSDMTYPFPMILLFRAKTS